jgi:hypothetical protein
MPQNPRANSGNDPRSRALTEAEIRKHLQTVRLVRMDLVSATVFPVPCERLRMCKRYCRTVGSKLASIPGPDGLSPDASKKADVPASSITAQQLAAKMRRVGFEIDELVTSNEDVDVRKRWKRIWRAVRRLGNRLVVLGNTAISYERVICSEPRHRLSKELRECMKTLSAQIRLETSEWMLQAMDRRSSAGSQEGTSQPKTELVRNGPR